ncbi:MAG: hypothetical protein ACI9OJ_002694 [Myxococcota bacterium]|jgi:hypothetical protein
MAPKTKTSRKRRRSSELTWRGFGLRWVAAFLLVLLTYNPAGWSYIHWVTEFQADNGILKLLTGFVLLGGYVIYFRATSLSLGRVGSALILVIFGLLLLLMVQYQIMPKDQTVLRWALMIIAATFLAIGMTGSFLWRRMTGQYQVSEEDGDNLD